MYKLKFQSKGKNIVFILPNFSSPFPPLWCCWGILDALLHPRPVCLGLTYRPSGYTRRQEALPFRQNIDRTHPQIDHRQVQAQCRRMLHRVPLASRRGAEVSPPFPSGREANVSSSPSRHLSTIFFRLRRTGGREWPKCLRRSFGTRLGLVQVRVASELGRHDAGVSPKGHRPRDGSLPCLLPLFLRLVPIHWLCVPRCLPWNMTWAGSSHDAILGGNVCWWDQSSHTFVVDNTLGT